jgi:HlyD family secretion protein
MAYPRVGSPTRSRVTLPPILTGAVVIVVIVGILGLTGVLAQARQLIPGLRQTTLQFQTRTVQRGDISVNVIATGPISAINTTPLTFKTSGKLKDLKVSVGDRVTKGQVLALLDTTDLQTALDQAKANLSQAQANLAKVEGGPTDAQKAVAQASVDNAKTAATNAQASVATTKTSVANDITASQASLRSAQLTLAAAQDSLTAAQDQESRGIAADQTAVTNAQKNLEAAKAAAAADGPILQQQLEKAKDSLWSAQISRDATCGRSHGADCQAANANVAGAETAVNTAAAQVTQSQQQDQQQIAQAQAQLDQANAQLANDKAKLAAAVVSAENQVKQAQASVDSAKNGVAQAQAKATATVQSAQAQADQANGSLKSAQANYAQTVAPPDPADVAAAKAQVVNAQAALETAQANFDAATLTAPSDGTIAAVNGAIGQYVSGGPVATGDTALFTLVDLNNLQVTAQVNEADIGKVKIGDPVTYTVSAYPDLTFNGKVVAIQPTGTVVQNVVNYAVTCSIQAAKGATLYPGMTASASIISDQRNGVVVVPNSALSFAQSAFRDGLIQGAGRQQQATNGNRPSAQNAGSRPQGQQAFNRAGSTTGGPNANGQQSSNRGVVLTMSDGQLVPVRVTLGITDGTNTEVVAGLKEGDSIVIGQSNGSSGNAGNSSGGPRPAGGPFGGGFRG